MPQPIILPPRQNQWENFGSQILQQSILLGLQSKYNAKAQKAELELERQADTEKRRKDQMTVERNKALDERYSFAQKGFRPIPDDTPTEGPRWDAAQAQANERGLNLEVATGVDGTKYVKRGKYTPPKLTQYDVTKDLIDPSGKIVRKGTPATKTATTPMAHFLQQNPNATSGQVLAYNKKLQKDPALNEVKLTQLALQGTDQEQIMAKNMLNMLLSRKKEVATAQGEAMVGAKIDGIIDVDGTARAVVEGRELFSKVKNTFGVPVAETIRKAVLKLDPDFNFVKPEMKYAGISKGYVNLQNQRVMMGSFVNNIKKQVDRVTEIMQDVTKRVGVRAIDLPKRELVKRMKGSGHEVTVEAYLTEISNEIGKISTGSERSIRELSADAQEKWQKLHDPNLSLKQLGIILQETKHMADMRIETVDEQMKYSMDLLSTLTNDTNVDIPTVATQGEFDALNSGDEYLEDGQLYRKP